MLFRTREDARLAVSHNLRLAEGWSIPLDASAEGSLGADSSCLHMRNASMKLDCCILEQYRNSPTRNTSLQWYNGERQTPSSSSSSATACFVFRSSVAKAKCANSISQSLRGEIPVAVRVHTRFGLAKYTTMRVRSHSSQSPSVSVAHGTAAGSDLLEFSGGKVGARRDASPEHKST